jgi:predicted RNase H-like nuclease (RuvC/YqgF family)
MSALKIAEQHLNEALSRLEQVMARRLAATDPDQAAVVNRLTQERDALVRDVDLLRAECERLGEALKSAEREHGDMKETTGMVARRLDNSIEELDRMIGD